MEVRSSTKQTNPILLAQSISKQLAKIEKDATHVSAAQIKLIKDNCIKGDDSGISLAASRGLVFLAENDVIQTSSTLSELVASLSLVTSYTGITSAMCDLLFLDLRLKMTAKEDSNKCSYNLRAPQHPLISLFIRNADTCHDVLTKIKYFYASELDEVTVYANETLFPFYMYMLCNPTSDVPNQFFFELWSFLLTIKGSQSLDLTEHLIIWLQTSNKKQTLKASKALRISTDVCLRMKRLEFVDGLVLTLTAIIYKLIKFQMDPREVIMYLYDRVKESDNLQDAASCMLSILAECVFICPSNYLDDLLRLCSVILELGASNKFASYLLKAAVLQWTAYGCLLTSRSLAIANEILTNIESSTNFNSLTSNLTSNKPFCYIKNANRIVCATVQLNVLTESDHDLSIWLNKFDEVVPIRVLKRFFNYFIAIFLYKDVDYTVTLKTIELLLKVADFYKETTTQLLTLFLYKLANETNSRIHFTLLKALPKMAVIKENLPLVLNTFESFSKGLKWFALVLFYDLWNTNEKCYMHLQNMLLSNQKMGNEKEFYIAKARIVKEVCLKRPEVHGSELVSHLSEILNKCTDESGGVASAIALDALKSLCKVGIVDINSAWNQLSPKFKTEQRTVVLKSFCQFMMEVSYFDSSDCLESVLNDVLNTLWGFAVKSQNADVVSAACDALGYFTFEQISLHFPEDFRTGPNELGFNLIPGKFWINLLLNIEHFALEALGDLLIKLAGAEISGYRKGTYTVPAGQGEPSNYNYLPEQSIISALENYTRAQVDNWQHLPTKPVYLQCLRILSQQYSKPLPPVNWYFLQILVHIPESRRLAIIIASHQVQLSGSARNLIQNIINALCEMPAIDVADLESVYANLKFLGNSIQPGMLRPFIEWTFKFGLERGLEESDFSVLESIIQHLCLTLRDDNLQEANRTMLSQVIVNAILQVDLDSVAFPILLECVAVLPIRCIDELSSPRLWKDPTDCQVKMSIQIRSFLALKATVSPFTWLNDIIDSSNVQSWHSTLFFKHLTCITQMHRNSDFAASWIIELMGNTQSTMANEHMSQQHLKFLCDVFILTVIILSGHDFYHDGDELIRNVDIRLELLPQSIAELLKLPAWKSYTTQIAEWLYHMVKANLIPNEYKIALFVSLVGLKHEDVFQKSSKWMSYVGINLPLYVD